jgi:UDP-glucose 4-epimerase
VLAALRTRGDHVVGLVRNPQSLPEWETRTLDISRPDGIDKVLAGFDGVVHAAAHVPKSYTDPGEAQTCLEVNALGTLALLRACVAAGVPRVIVFSGNIYRPGTAPMAEDGPIAPSAQAPYYLASKACADFYADAMRRAGNLSIAVLRPAAVYGPGLARGMIPTFISRLEAGERLTIQDGGRYRADLVYVEDVAQATAAALSATATGPFNLGSGTTCSSLEIAYEVARLLNAPRDLIDVQPTTGAEVVGGFSPLEINRARAAFGYSPRDAFAGLQGYLTWWRGRK